MKILANKNKLELFSSYQIVIDWNLKSTRFLKRKYSNTWRLNDALLKKTRICRRNQGRNKVLDTSDNTEREYIKICETVWRQFQEESL